MNFPIGVRMLQNTNIPIPLKNILRLLLRRVFIYNFLVRKHMKMYLLNLLPFPSIGSDHECIAKLRMRRTYILYGLPNLHKISAIRIGCHLLQIFNRLFRHNNYMILIGRLRMIKRNNFLAVIYFLHKNQPAAVLKYFSNHGTHKGTFCNFE